MFRIKPGQTLPFPTSHAFAASRSSSPETPFLSHHSNSEPRVIAPFNIVVVLVSAPLCKVSVWLFRVKDKV